MKRLLFLALVQVLATLNVGLCHANSRAPVPWNEPLLAGPGHGQPRFMSPDPEAPCLMRPGRRLCPFSEQTELFPPGQMRRIHVDNASISSHITKNNGEVSKTSLDSTRKSPLAAGLLGGLVGYGSGQFYTKRRLSGFAFLATDGLCTLLLIGGFTLPFSSTKESEGWETVGAVGANAFGAAVLISAGGLGLIVSHVAQAIWGPIAANRYNRDLSQKKGNMRPLLIPGEDSLRVGFCWSF